MTSIASGNLAPLDSWRKEKSYNDFQFKLTRLAYLVCDLFENSTVYVVVLNFNLDLKKLVEVTETVSVPDIRVFMIKLFEESQNTANKMPYPDYLPESLGLHQKKDFFRQYFSLVL